MICVPQFSSSSMFGSVVPKLGGRITVMLQLSGTCQTLDLYVPIRPESNFQKNKQLLINIHGRYTIAIVSYCRI